jgi:hypothetical protein
MRIAETQNRKIASLTPLSVTRFLGAFWIFSDSKDSRLRAVFLKELA